MSSLKDLIFTKVSESSGPGSNKVTVVGCGQVGMAAVISVLAQVRSYFVPFQNSNFCNLHKQKTKLELVN